MMLAAFRTSAHFALCCAAIGGLTLAGCGQQAGDGSAAQVSDPSPEGHDHEGEEAHEHGDWWCAEHGVPEKDCSICNATAAAKFKEKGDWCDEHHRAKSQCFECDPARAEKFAKLYEAKFGHSPPKSPE